MTQNDTAWGKIFDRLPLLPTIEQHGFAYVSADEIKEASDKREPRLLAKQDTKDSRPEVFKRHKLSMLPVENGKYVIFKDEALATYYALEQLFSEIIPEEYHPERNFNGYQTIQTGKITSESQAIDFANMVSLIKTFTNETELFLTIRGRQRSENFPVTIPTDHLVEISGVQIEVDAGFESPDKIYLIEAKLGRVENFNIRQLYYPFKDWSVKSTKEIIPIFFVYTNGLFYIFQFAFGDRYGDLQLIQGKCFTVNEPVKQSVNLLHLLETTTLEIEPGVPYPQANDLDKVIDIITNFRPSNLTDKSAIAEFFDFDKRQGDYYANAAIYLGLLKRGQTRSSEFELTREGIFIANSPNRSQRNFLLLKQLLKKPSFNDVLTLFVRNKYNITSLSTTMLASIIQRHVQLNDTTARRRASTVISWLKWLKNNMDFV